jgi:hypothetical protein
MRSSTDMMEEDELALIAIKKRGERLAKAAIYRAENKEKLLAYNKAYFERKNQDEEFVKKQRKSISISKKKRRAENKKGSDGAPKRVYVRRILPPPSI